MRILFITLFISFYFVASAQFIIEEKILKTKTGDLKGTLFLPQKLKKFKLVFIQAGSGPTDRNGNSGNAIKANSYRLIAEELAKKILVLY